jgi:prophage regulatory protein
MKHVYRIIDLASSPKQKGKLPVSSATIWRWVKAGTFPAPFKIGPNTTVFDGEKVDQYLAQCANGECGSEA